MLSGLMVQDLGFLGLGFGFITVNPKQGFEIFVNTIPKPDISLQNPL